MEFIGMKFIMSRLLDNPIMTKLKLSSAAAYVKDFSSINNINPIVDYGYTYVSIQDYRGVLPPALGEVQDVYLCNSTTSKYLTENNKLSATMKSSKIPNKDKRVFGAYVKKANYIDTDIPSGVLEIYHTLMRVDELGFPVLPYDGSLMEAVINYIKYRYFTILYENDIISRDKKQEAHSEYTWYIGQYTMKNTIPSYDEAVSWANSWQRLLDTKNLDQDTKSFPQHLNL